MAEFSDKIAACLWLICTLLTIVGCAYALLAAREIGRFFSGYPPAPDGAAPVTVLKPLRGDEPGLELNLASFRTQDYAGPVQLACGVADPADPAAAVVERLKSRFPAVEIDLVANADQHGANRKISNIINIMTVASHNLLVLSDSDIRVPQSYLRDVTAALSTPGVGLVTCLYRGLPVAGIWSRLAAAAIDQHFLPGVLVGLRFGLAAPCFGSTIALSAATLNRIGGFRAFADHLADDYALGDAVRRLGLRVAIPPIVVDHTCPERSFADLVRHELRWARTIRLVDPKGYAGSAVTHALPFALAAAALGGFDTLSLILVAGALACRLSLPLQIDRVLGGGRVPVWLSPVRDILSFAIYLASYLPGPIIWRGERFRVHSDGTLKQT